MSPSASVQITGSDESQINDFDLFSLEWRARHSVRSEISFL